MATQITPRQLELARRALFHQDGDALRTLDDQRAWIEEVGLAPMYPHAQFQAPQPSFAEAVLGRPMNGWVPTAKSASAPDGSEEESYAVEVEDEEPVDEVADPQPDEEDYANDEEGDEAAEEGDGAIALDDETIVSNDDLAEEDEGDEIAEQDWIDAGANPVPNDVRESEPAPEPVNGFSPEERETVSRAMARLVAEGAAVPLNLLGSTTGEPDFVCSAQAFSFVYTLRGDKNWKAAPEQTGNMRVSPLAVKVYDLLKEKGAQAPHEITQQLGQGLVDSAVLRALAELWAILRVIPLPNADGEPAKWELTTGRFMRAIKAGANAGQPTALSALLSLYLPQVIAATSDEMEIYLSPLAARSRVREVVHGLAASRQLDEIVVEGRTLLHIAGALPELPADDTDGSDVPARVLRSRYESDDRAAELRERVERGAAGGPRGERGGDRPQRRGNFPVRRPAAAGDAPRERRERPAGGDRERRPFQRNDRPQEEGKPRNEFARPWDDDRAARPRPEGRPPFRGEDRGGQREGGGQRDIGGERRPFRPRPEGGDRRGFRPREGGDREGGFRPAFRREGGDRTFRPRTEGGGDRPFRPRTEGGGDRPFRPRTEGSGDRPFRPRTEAGGDRPFRPRTEGSGDRPYRPRTEGGGDRPFRPRTEGGGDRPFRPRTDGGGDRPYRPRPEGGGDRPFRPRTEGGGDRPYRPRPEGGGDRPFRPRAEGGGDRPFRPRTEGFGGGEGRPRREGGFSPRPPRREGGFEGRPRREGGEGGDRRPGRPSFGGGRPGGRPSGGPGRGPGGFGGGFGGGRGGSRGPGRPAGGGAGRPPRRPRTEE